ncbi:restriction endonuclease fold toxin-2 domain-containing protein [Streptomyces sp. NRRL S-1022]|uniref:restriction endonuclease fold toxin-2 domain-containing protein n=1 Tax=Streptomyces sp. NRRL S-1022 TaxID=1463880 RepID=UPI0004C12DC7|nr:restriction endonuclease fold toxin-2 domain-containing protein [Streptomyces sp. NRRL S-1022]
MGLSPDLKLIVEGMVKASMGMVDTVMVGTRDTAIALFHELDRQHGMAGDDDAGRAFAKVYESAAATTLDMIGFSAYVMGETGKGLMRTCRELMAQESSIASAILGRQVDLTYRMGDPAADCSESFLGRGQELSEVVGETAWYDQYAPAGMSDRFRGSPEKLRDVAGTWRRGAKLMTRFLEDAQVYAHTADKAHSGEAADAFHSYFKGFVGFAAPPERAHPDEPLVANLVAACTQLAKACERYADHVEAAKRQITKDRVDPFHVDMPWDSPMFGGNGDDGGLLDAVLGDPWIHRLGDVAHSLDGSEKRVKLPQGSGGAPGLPGVPLLPVPEPVTVPVPLALASYKGGLPGVIPAVYRDPDPSLPFKDPLPPEPGTTRLLSTGERKEFEAWVNTLRPMGFGGKGTSTTDPANAYQLRTAGYPERLIPLPAEARKGAIAADGMRPADGYMIDAKYVKDTDDECKKNSWRTPDTFALEDKYDKNGKKKWSKKDILVGKDEDELDDYRQAMTQHEQIRGLEIITNDNDAAAYWQTLMAAQGVKGTSRYVP